MRSRFTWLGWSAIVLTPFAIVLLAWVILIPDSRHEYIVSPTADAAAVSVSNCANVAFEERRQAEKYSRERPGTHVFEVSFRMIR